MSGLPLPVSPALNILSGTITAYDKTGGGYTDGRYSSGSIQPDYTFAGNVQPSTPKDLKFLPEGDRSDGAITITTRTELFFTDTSQQTGQEFRQTFIRHQDEIWRVRGLANWAPNSGFFKYVCTKFLEEI